MDKRYGSKWNKNNSRLFFITRNYPYIYAPIYTQEKYPIEKLKECYLKLFNKIIKEKYKLLAILK